MEKKLDLKVEEVSKNVAVNFINGNHYSPVMPRITYHFLGFFIRDRLVGILTLGHGTYPLATAKKLFGEEGHTGMYLEIGKMCMSDELETNAESQMISKTVKWLKKNRPDVHYLYTMADGGMGKVGYCYQASNFFYGGSFDTHVFCTPTMEKVHQRSMRGLLDDNLEYLETFNPDHKQLRAFREGKRKSKRMIWPTAEYLRLIGWRWYKVKMFRYLYPLKKTSLKYLNKSEDWSRTNFPKDKDLNFRVQTIIDGKVRFLPTEPPRFNMGLDNMLVNKVKRD